MDQAQLDEIQVDSTTCVPAEGWQGIIPREGNGGCTSSSPESSSVNGDARRAGKRQRRRKRSSRGESKAVGAEERLSHGDSHRLSPGPSSMLLGLQAETIWFSRSAYEQAEGSYQRWLVSSACKASAPGGSSPHQALCQETLQGPPPAAPMVSEQPADCHQANQEVCYHLVNKPVFNSAERNFMERAAPGPLPLAPGGGPSVQPTPDEGYLTLAPTPATPSPVARQESINGLPRFPAQLLTGVWLEKPRYDLAESAFYQRLYGLSPGPVPVGAEPLVTKDTRRGAEVVKEQNRPGPKEDGTTPRDNTMSAVQYLTQEKIWFEKPTYDEAEKRLYEGVNGPTHQTQETGANTILQDIARARENIQKSLAGLKTTLHPGKGSSCPPKNRQVQPSTVPGAGDHGEIITRMKNLELENQSLHRVVEDLRSALSKLEARVAVLEKVPAAAAPVAAAAPCAKAIPVQQPKVRAPVEEVDDDLDLFGSDEEEDAEAERIREERVKAYTERKAKKPAIIAKSSILLDVKPWDDETDMAKLEECVRSVQADGLVWGTSKLVPVGYGIRKLQIQCVVEDDKVGTDMLEEEITRFEDYVQSVDVAAFNKI